MKIIEKTVKKQVLTELTKEEILEINGGSERKDEKRSGWFKSLWDKITGSGN